MARLLFVGLVASSLVGGVLGGLVRAGVLLPGAVSGGWVPHAVLAHAFLMVSGFMGTVIGLERAVALKARWSFWAPSLSALGGVCALAGAGAAAAALAVAAALLFVGVNLHVVRRHREPHTVLLLVGAVGWLVGNALYAAGLPADAVVPWWFSFLVLTIAAERLEMTRLMRRRAGAAEVLYLLLGTLLAGAATASLAPAAGQLVFGLALAGLAVWLLCFDIARRTVKANALSRYMAVCLLLGYGWLGVAGLAWIGVGLGHAVRDTALHALALGFVVSMMLAHAPVILPAVAKVKLLYGPVFYLPLALLHLSLLVRVGVPGLLPAGAIGNAAAMGLFAAIVAGAAWAWRRKHSSTSSLRTRHASAHH
ncbi:hypothetical protein AAW51_4195 [Caldimonas brevitalea]|uniref:NnrS family protein n=1 Tax=Caldimonas brevitalea TaxID=413882 RepID=A0A0G3BU48_9BURK|nr:hypothetical protein AAW51_4195 [Caldimonas brevitalea]